GEDDESLVVPLLRDRRPERERVVTALAEAHLAGLDVDWRPLLSGGRRVDLPTYAFRRERFWLAPGAETGDLTAAGIGAAEHPLLGATVTLAGEGDEWLFTGRLSLDTQPWLADHVVLDTVLLPGTAFVELALRAAGE